MMTTAWSGRPWLEASPPHGSYYRADRTPMGELVLHGRFYHVPQWLFFRRDHADRAEWKFRDVRSWCTNLDPRRAKPLPASAGQAVPGIPLGVCPGDPDRAADHRRPAGLLPAPGRVDA